MLIAAERSSWSRHGLILEIPDVSKEEALKYFEGWGFKKEEALELYVWVRPYWMGFMIVVTLS